jgi:protein phosphatase
MLVGIPEIALVLLIGPRGVGKSRFAARHFEPGQILSLPQMRKLVCDQPDLLEATNDAAELQSLLVEMRLAWGRLTVVDSTNLRLRNRQNLLTLARKFHIPVVAIVFDLPGEARAHGERQAPKASYLPGIPDVLTMEPLEDQLSALRDAMPRLGQEGFYRVYFLSTPEERDSAQVQVQKLPCNRKDHGGPFDLIGDVHGCCDELESLLRVLGYQQQMNDSSPGGTWRHPEGRTAVFVGDILDRGPRILDTFRLVRSMVAAGSGLAVQGNHELKVYRHFKAPKPEPRPSIMQTLREIEDQAPDSQRETIRDLVEFIENLPHHLVLDEGRLVAAHAGLREDLHGRDSFLVRNQALFGDANARFDDEPDAARLEWVQHYRGRALVVYGHTPVLESTIINRTINIDTGCVFGGRLTALRYPEMDTRWVVSQKAYAVQRRSGPDGHFQSRLAKRNAEIQPSDLPNPATPAPHGGIGHDDPLGTDLSLTPSETTNSSEPS